VHLYALVRQHRLHQPAAPKHQAQPTDAFSLSCNPAGSSLAEQSSAQQVAVARQHLAALMECGSGRSDGGWEEHQQGHGEDDGRAAEELLVQHALQAASSLLGEA